MSTITRFDKPVLRRVKIDVEAALKSVGAKYGIKISLDGGSYTDDTYSTKITMVTQATADKQDAIGGSAKWQAGFLKNYFWMGLKKEHLGKQFKFQGETVTLVGARPKAALPLVLMTTDGKFKAVSTLSVKTEMARAGVI